MGPVSNTLAIAAVTSTMRHVLHESLGGAEPGAVGGADVTTLRPSDLATEAVLDDGAAGLNVYLYQVTPNHAWDLHDLPTRHSSGTLARPPLAALDLHYLVTAYGDDSALEPQRLLARGALALSATPVFTRPVITAAVVKYGLGDTAFLADSDLADQSELVKVSPAPLSLEEVSKLWGAFSTPYLLSVGYTATVVLLETYAVPHAALPVARRALDVRPLHRPEIADVTVASGGPPVTGATLVVAGSSLLGAHTFVTVGEHRITPEPESTTTQVRCVIPPGVPAGLRALRILDVVPADPASGSPERISAQSGSWPWAVVPTVGAVSVAGGTVRIPVTPQIRAAQRVSVTFGRLAGGAPGDPEVLGVAVPPVDEASAPLATVEIPVADLGSGTWLVRIEVDGVASHPSMSGDTYDGPAVTLP